MKKILFTIFLLTGLVYAQNNVTWRTVTIDSGAVNSSTLDLEGDNLKIIGIIVDTTGWTSANLTIDEYNKTLGDWASVQDLDGTAFTITLGAIAEPKSVYLLPTAMAGLEKIRFVSSAAQDIGDVNIYVKLRAY